MAKGYKHLTYEDRCQIYALLKRNISVQSIADDLSLHRSTIYRELIRNKGLRGYRYKQADCKSKTRRSHTSSHSNRRMTPEVIEIVEFLLQTRQWSPDQISGYCRKLCLAHISHETIYKHIWLARKQGRMLLKKLASLWQEVQQTKRGKLRSWLDSRSHRY